MCDRLQEMIEAAALLEAPVTGQRSAGEQTGSVGRASQAGRREMSKTLVYERTGEDDKYLPLIMSPENARAAVGIPARHRLSSPTQCARSNPTSIFRQPCPERLFARKPEGVPDWVLPVVEES